MASAFLLVAEKVIAIDRFGYRLQMASEETGAETMNYEEANVLEVLNDITAGRGPDAYIDAVGLEAHSDFGPLQLYDPVKQAAGLETTVDQRYGRPFSPAATAAPYPSSMSTADSWTSFRSGH
jgi:threonine dehydrogenase-like Zn-dependent dehydrogenase